MTLSERVVEVLERWCGDTVTRTDEPLQELWDRTKPTGTPSHSGIDFYTPGASDLINRLTSEYQRPRPEMRTINFGHQQLEPTTGTILTVADLFLAVSECPVRKAAPVPATLSAAARTALANEVAETVLARMQQNKTASKQNAAKKAAKKQPAKPKKG